jgi:hypothetical protein
LFPGAIKGPQIVEFLEHLLRRLPGIAGDLGRTAGPPQPAGESFVASKRGRLELGRLLACAPALNPVKYLFPPVLAICRISKVEILQWRPAGDRN